MGWTIGVDVGGTFTDFYAAGGEPGTFFVHKTSSTPSNPADAILNGLVALCAKHAIPMERIDRVSHGTTVCTNALIQRTGKRVALVTTKGFRDLLEIGRQTRPHMYDLQSDHPAPLAEREDRFELDERIGAAGEVVRAPSDDEIDRVIDDVIASGAEACAVGFLFAFRNPEHEQRFAARFRQRAPGIALSLSSEVQPEFREYERLSTTVLNAYLQPIILNYIQTLVAGVAEAYPDLTAETHGEAVSFEFIAEVDPEWIFVVDRGAAIGQDGEAAAVTLDNPLVAGTRAGKAGQIVYLASAPLYLSGGGIQSMMGTIREVSDAMSAAGS